MDLPKGLVTTSTRIPSHLEDPNVIDALDIARLWKGKAHPPTLY